jgi:hypothetical protein
LRAMGLADNGSWRAVRGVVEGARSDRR